MHKYFALPHDGAENAKGGFARGLRGQGVFAGLLVSALLGHSVQALIPAIPLGPSVVLTWSPSLDTNVIGYNLYYGGASGNYTNLIHVGNVTNATVTGLSAGATYFFAATAYDLLAEQSIFSNEAIYLVPAAPASPQISIAPAGMMLLMLMGPSDQTYEIQATQDFFVWTTIGTVTVGVQGSLDFTDTNAANCSQRFYRTLATP